jgi:voltage-gated potassium channel
MGTRKDRQRPEELDNAGYEMFIAGVSILSVIDFGLEFAPRDSQIRLIAWLMEVPFTLILLIDFAHRLLRSHPRNNYFVRELGFLDLLGCLPGFKIFRLFRVVRAVRMLRRFGGRAIVRDLVRGRAENALLTILLLVLVLLQFGSMAVFAAEQSSPDANIKTGGEAVWWAFVSITTVGYGDYTPVTPLGRTIAIVILATGVALFGALSGFLAHFFLSPPPRDITQTAAYGERDPLAMLAELEASLSDQVRSISAIRAAILAVPDLDSPHTASEPRE